MSDELPADRLASRPRPVRRAAVAAALLAGAALVCFHSRPPAPAATAPESPPAVREASAARVRQFCGVACHAYPPPDSFPRSAWRREVQQAYDLFGDSDLHTDFPSQEAVARYYERRAPAELPLLKVPKPARGPAVSFRRTGYRIPGAPGNPAVSHVNLVRLFDRRRLDVLACEMRRGEVLALQPYADPPAWRVLYRDGPDKGFNPAHAEVVDLDRDGVPDVLVANLGSFGPTDAPCGSVLWLRGLGEGRFEPHTLLDGVGRVTDVRAADFRGTGKLDLVMAAFGWRNTGEVIYLENQTTDWKRPRFVPRVVDDRHGSIHVPVGDLNGDGKPDFVALISQEHETIVAFVNEGGGKFRKETVYAAPHPAYGSSGIQLVDLDGDGDLDVLYTNGDTLDPPALLKPYHGVQWLENRGGFPFVHHPLTAMYGAMRAVAADFTGRGRKDVVAVSFLAAGRFPRRKELGLDSVILLEQTAAGEFSRHSLETVDCDHFSCAAGDVFGDGVPHLVTGNFRFDEGDKPADALTLWRNLRPRRPPAP